jgi:hypothetical protein
MNDTQVPFQMRIDPQPEDAGYSVVIVFAPELTYAAAQDQCTWISEQLHQLGWECGRNQ